MHRGVRLEQTIRVIPPSDDIGRDQTSNAAKAQNNATKLSNRERCFEKYSPQDDDGGYGETVQNLVEV